MSQDYHDNPHSILAAEDRRSLPRWELMDTANLILDSGMVASCPIDDVSGGGLAVQTGLTPQPDDEAVIYVRSLGRFRAKVARVANGKVAFRFLIQDERQILLLQRLERLLQRQRDAAEPQT